MKNKVINRILDFLLLMVVILLIGFIFFLLPTGCASVKVTRTVTIERTKK